jgi:hypothetical protein
MKRKFVQQQLDGAWDFFVVGVSYLSSKTL